MRGRAIAALALTAALTAALATACSDDDGTDAGPSSSETPSTTPSTAASSPTSPTSPSSPSSPTSASGGPADRPAPLTARDDLLAWRPVPGSTDRAVSRTVTQGGTWTLGATDAKAVLTGPRGTTSYAAAGRRVSDALVDQQYAVVVLQDEAEQRPSVATVTDLRTGKSFTLDGRSDVPTTTGGVWALGAGRLLHATVRGGAYCLATVDLATRAATVGWCAEKQHGFNAAHVTPAGDSVLGFDAGRPSCRTALALAGSTATPFTGVTRCKAWEGLVTDDGAVWSVIPREQETEAGHYYARTGDSYVDLGVGVSSTLTWCAGAAYFARDPEREGRPATLMRWSPGDGLTVAYRSPPGDAFLEPPRCGGNTLTVTALTSSGDEQVTADL